MGGVFGKKKKKTLHLLFVGPANGGKTTLLHHLMRTSGVADAPAEVAPTIGVKAETFKFGKHKFVVFDFSGAASNRALWNLNISDAQGIVFVVDGTDKRSLPDTKQAMDGFMKELEAAQCDVPLMFLSNKCDLAQCMATDEVAASLQLDNLERHEWHIARTSGKTGQGVKEGFDWLIKSIKKNKAG